MTNPPSGKKKWSKFKIIISIILCLFMFVLLGILLLAVVPILMSQLFG